MRTFRLLSLTLAASGAFGSPTAADDPPPVATGLTESVEVRLVTMDVFALDAKDRTVPDLTKEDFQLLVDRKETPIDTLDIACDGGSVDDPRSKHFGDWTTPPDLAAGTRRVVLAFDYLHLPSTPCPDAPDSRTCMYHTQSLKDYQVILASTTDVRDQEIVVVALTGGLRVEQPFTRDRDAVAATLHRMEHDITLWNGTFGHLIVTAVLSDPLSDNPFTARVALSVPEIPKRDAFLAGPIFGRRSGDDVVVYGRKDDAGAPADRVGDRTSFRPRLVSEVNRDQPLAALTHACVVRPRRRDGPWIAARTLLTEGGSVVGAVPEIAFDRDGKDVVQCRRFFDELPVSTLRVGRYTFQATLAHAGAGIATAETRQVPVALIGTAAARP